MPAVVEEAKLRTFTPDDLLRMPSEGMGYELVDGQLKELNVSFLSSYCAGQIFAALRAHVHSRKLGWVTPEGTSYQCFPDDPKRIRRADTAVHQLDRLSTEQAQVEGHCTVAPDLVVEVISPNDLGYEIEGKRNEWLDAGVRLVWIIYPAQQTIFAYLPDGDVKQFKRTDILTAEPVLPEFRVPVADLFELPAAPTA